MKKTKLLTASITGALAACMSVTAFAQGKIFVDLQEVKSDTPPQIINERTMVPVRAITEMLGYDVNWIPEKKQVEVCESGSTVPVIIMNIDKNIAYYSRYEEELGDTVGFEVVLDSPATLINDRTFVPLRFVSEAVGYTVDYDVDSADVYMFSPEYLENQIGEGKGEDIDSGEGIGNAKELTTKEMDFLLSCTTETWFDLSQAEKAEVAVLIGRWWEVVDNIIVEDYDELVSSIEHQMEQYSKNDVDERVFDTACDIYGVDVSNYIKG